MLGSGQHKGSTSASGKQSWRSLGGGRPNRRIQSPAARKRRFLRIGKVLAVIVIFAVIVGGVAAGVVALIQRDAPIQVATPSKPVERILFDTDGVLPDGWLGSVIELRRGLTLMEIDIHEMKRRLEGHGQVKSAAVERVFPDALRIRVREREPVLRMQVARGEDAGEGARSELRIVARDGTLYKGVGYPEASLRAMPYLVPYTHSDGRVLPIRGIEQVADLLEIARRTRPDFFRSWQIVSLEHFSGDPELPGQVIEVRTSLVPRIIFGTNVEFAQQLDRLTVVLNYVRNRGNPALKQIDLSLHDSAAVRFASGRISTF